MMWSVYIRRGKVFVPRPCGQTGPGAALVGRRNTDVATGGDALIG
jgi:hypothetical protein